ncbi:DUF3298 and DUF4163 domain-containing protein [Paenibacillus sp. 1001270B_150601_E10]|uniref:DUF3298 and DUF4163 domain-containing protein n=1 Tax=Paenibacillus sp. 1001270B_150601_E10 TaxID=2787079 RepID=UPI00189D9CFC|nr:DUF3298 and DUF4163 domain-containing protein [Paenibacillus sp. 1001270B_150601_E10]
MRNLDPLKKRYQDIPIPAELDDVVNQALKASKRKDVRTMKSVKWAVGTAAAAAVIFVGSVNASPAVVNALSDVPVLSSIVKVVTFRDFKVDEGNYNADLKVPAIKDMDNQLLEEQLNSKYVQENKELYQAFMKEMEQQQKAGGGHLGVNSGYEVKTDNDSILSIERYVNKTMGSTEEILQFDTIDKKNEVLLTLPSLFKDDSYISLISSNIKEQMEAQMKKDENKTYWIGENAVDGDAFTSIKADQNFYINNEGKLVISFNKYEVAPGSMGSVEFVIPTDAIANALVSHAYVK